MTDTQDDVLEIKLSDGVRLAVPASLGSITSYVLLEQEAWFEKEVDFLRAFLKPGMTAVDIGANLGVYSLAMARLVGETGRVFAYEPGSAARGLLERSRELNGATHLQISPQALSDRPREGRLVFGASSELNALGESGAGEAIHITSLDAEDAARDWTPDFVKIDAEGQEAAILEGGRSFFARHSPLVMFEIKELATFNERLRQLFPSIGYRLFRQLGGAPILVPDNAARPLDSYELNLFGAKQDRINHLAQRGLLVDTIAAWEPTEADHRDAAALWRSQTFVQRANMTAWLTADAEYRDGLAAYAVWRAADRPTGVRCAALAFAVRAVGSVCGRAPTPARLSTWARVAWEWGARDESVAALQRLLTILQSGGIRLDEPFWPAAARFDDLDLGDKPAAWLVAASAEQYEKTFSLSSFFGGPTPTLAWLAAQRFAAREIERRRVLCEARAGGNPTVPPSLCTAAPDHLNADIWRAGRVPGTVAAG
jgi:FkbM family methyltransferase